MTEPQPADPDVRKQYRAINAVPRHLRNRYAEEWHADFSEANDARARHDVAKAAARMARRLSLRHVGEMLLGGHGIGFAFLW